MSAAAEALAPLDTANASSAAAPPGAGGAQTMFTPELAAFLTYGCGHGAEGEPASVPPFALATAATTPFGTSGAASQLAMLGQQCAAPSGLAADPQSAPADVASKRQRSD